MVVFFYHSSSWGRNTDMSFICVTCFPPKRKTVSKMCHFKVGQYDLALLNSLQKEAYEHSVWRPSSLARPIYLQKV